MYIEEKILAKDEKVLLVVKRNKIILFWEWFFGVLLCWFLLIPLIIAIVNTIKFNHTEYVVTDKKVIEKYGLVSIVCNEMGLNCIENITISYTFCGRIFNYANICIQGTNINNIDFLTVKNAPEVRQEIFNIIEGYKASIEKVAEEEKKEN